MKSQTLDEFIEEHCPPNGWQKKQAEKEKKEKDDENQDVSLLKSDDDEEDDDDEDNDGGAQRRASEELSVVLNRISKKTKSTKEYTYTLHGNYLVYFKQKDSRVFTGFIKLG